MKRKIGTSIFIFILFATMVFTTMVRAEDSTFKETKSIFKVGKNVFVQNNEKVKEDVISIGADAYINGEVDKDVIVIGGNVYINGEVKGDVTSIAGTISVGDSGKVEGKVNEMLTKLSGNYLKTRASYFANGHRSLNISLSSVVLGSIFSLIIYALAKKKVHSTAILLEQNFGKALAYGYVSLIVIPLIFLILIITLVGILLLPLIIIVIGIIYLIGFSSICLYLGKKFATSVMHVDIPEAASIVIGVLGIEILKSIPYIGSFASTFIVFPLSIGLMFIRNKNEYDWQVVS